MYLVLIGLLGLSSAVMAVDPFHVSIQPVLSNGNALVLNVQVSVPDHHKLYADQFRVDVPAPVRLIPRSLPAPEKQADPLSGENTLVFTRSFKALYAVENLNTNPLPVTVRWQGCNATVCFLPAAETFMVAWTDRVSSSGDVSAANTTRMESTISADWRALTNRFVLVAQQAGYLSPSELLSFLKLAQGQGGAAPESLPSGAREGWLASLPEALARADREQKPVFIDFWASWCKNCHAMEATTFRDAEVQKSLEGFVKVKVQAEHPNQSPDRETLDAFGVIGLPTYVILKTGRYP